MNRAFYNGISGSKSYQYGIDTIGNNIANINTNGYKANVPQFAELFTDKVASIKNSDTPVQSDQGFGVRANSSAIDLSQGNIQKTDRSLDLAIMGEGWFGLSNEGTDGINFTRNGSFAYNKDGDLVSPDGGYLMGTLSKELNNGKLNTIVDYMPLNGVDTQEPMKLPQNLLLGAVPTKNVSIHGNLGVEGVTQRYSTEIYTKAGDKRDLLIRIEKDLKQKEGESKWKMFVSIKDKEGKTLFKAKPEPLIFDGNGAIKTFTPPTIDNEGTKIKLSLGGDFNGLVALGGNFIGKDIVKDGTSKGNLLDYHLNQDGHLIANFDNGRASVVGKVAIYHFQNDQGLAKLGGNHFVQTANSGKPIFYQNEKGENIIGSKLAPYAVERANTSAATALTNLIIMQKAFDANAKCITTGDQLIQAALKML